MPVTFAAADYSSDWLRMLGEMGIAPQRTLRSAVGCRGIGLHCGQSVTMTLHPAPANSGIVFRRSDAGAEIRADWSNSVESALSTVLSNREGIQVATVEHLMAALAGNRVDRVNRLGIPDDELAGAAKFDNSRRAVADLGR